MPRKTQLVCQHLEHVSRDVLEQYQGIIREYVHRRHGIYALYRKGKLYYVGLASNLRGRLRSHLKDRHAASWDRFNVYLTIGSDHIRELEALVLRIIKPDGNHQIGQIKKSENLRVRLGRDIRRLHRLELNRMLGRLSPGKDATLNGRSDRGGGRRGVGAILDRLTRAVPIRAKYRGQVYKARLRRDGSVRFKKRTYATPTLASEAVSGRRINGLWFWRYQRAPGDWVRLRELKH